jgi:hypothetical protein
MLSQIKSDSFDREKLACLFMSSMSMVPRFDGELLQENFDKRDNL